MRLRLPLVWIAIALLGAPAAAFMVGDRAARPRIVPRLAPPPWTRAGARGTDLRVRYAWRHSGQSWQADWHVLAEWLREAELEIEALRDVVLAELDAQGIDRNRSDLALLFWRSAWQRIAESNLNRIDPVVATFRDFKREHGLDDSELKLLILSFVQSIRYATPDGELGIFAPPQTLVRAFGDCDTKALLYLLILRKLGYDALMLYSPYYQHAMVGIRARASGTYLEIEGHRYYFCETTQRGFRVGQLAASISDVRHWIPMRIL